MDNAIEARGLVKTYRGDVRALDGVSLAAEAGSVFGLLGPNGAGKSTAVKILTTLSRPDAGEAFVAGHDVLRHPARVRLAIGCVAQKSGLDLQATGRENLLLQGRVYGMRGKALRSRAQELIEPLRALRGRRPHRQDVLRRHAAQAGRRRRASCTGRRSSSSTSRPPVSTRRRAWTCGARSRASPATRDSRSS